MEPKANENLLNMEEPKTSGDINEVVYVDTDALLLPVKRNRGRPSKKENKEHKTEAKHDNENDKHFNKSLLHLQDKLNKLRKAEEEYNIALSKLRK